MYTIGISSKRKSFLENLYLPKANNPGPGTYNYTPPFGSDGIKYTKYNNNSAKSKTIVNKEKNLGPGEYETKRNIMNAEGRYTLSRFKNTCSLNFGLNKKGRNDYQGILY